MKKLAYSLLILLGLGLVLFYFFQERFLFLPGKRLSKETVYNFPETCKEIFIEREEGVRLNALHFSVPNSKGVVLFFHGNKGNLQRWGTLVTYFLEYQYDIVVIDYRGYGKSTGSFNELAMYQDAVAVYDYVNQQYVEENIVVYGRSLGATFAARVGVERSPKHIVLEAPFYNMKQAVKYNFSLSPTFLLRYKFETNIDAPKITQPITLFHGTADETTSFEGSRALFKLIRSAQKNFITLDGGTHHNLVAYEKYKEGIGEILN